MSASDPTLALALRRVLAPLVRLAMARGVAFPALSELLKLSYVRTAERQLTEDGAKRTDSRISVITGLQRRDVKALRTAPDDPPPQAGLLPRILAQWDAVPPFAKAPGTPEPLPMRGEESFEALVHSVSRDMHPRTALDELARLGLVTEQGDLITRTSAAFLPSEDQAAMVGYFGANLGDHAIAAAENLLAAPAFGPHFERAVHYNRLSEASAKALDARARVLFGEALSALNAEAAALQSADHTDPNNRHRVRLGAFTLIAETKPDGDTPP